MKQRLLGLLAIMAVFFALSPATSARGRHPEIEEALGALRNARAHLMAAAHDFHGHRADAIRATDEAIHQLEICMQYD